MRKRQAKKENAKSRPEVVVATPEDVAAVAETPPEVEATPETQPEAGEAQALEAERDEWRDKALRSRAELENVQRRLTAERQQAVRYANAAFARDLLGLLDTIELARQAGAKDEADHDAILASLAMLDETFRKTLADHQVTAIDADGKPFDPAEHEALQQQPSAEHEPGTVVTVVQTGYKLHDRVLRPARVIISAALPQDVAPESDTLTIEEGISTDADV